MYSCLDFYPKGLDQLQGETKLEILPLLAAIMRLCDLGLIRENFKNQYCVWDRETETRSVYHGKEPGHRGVTGEGEDHKKFLGKNYEVMASNGHVRDMPKSQMGFDPDNDFEPKYITFVERASCSPLCARRSRGG